MNTSRFRDEPPSRRILTLAVFLVAMAGTALLGVGQGDFTLAIVVACAAVLAFYLTEWTGLLQLSPLLANLAALVAVALVGVDVFSGDRAMQLIAIANLLVYLQIILLFQEKTSRVHWHLLLLALLQVVVGAALSLSATFGLLLLGFVVLSVFALHAFFLAQELGQSRPAPAASGTLTSEPARGAWGRRAAKPPAAHQSPPAPHQVVRRRWPYAGLPLQFTAVAAPPKDRTGGELRRTAASTLAALALSLPVAAVVFFAVPRMGTDPWRGGPAEQKRVVGFSQEVRLGELGTIADNTEVVMRVKFIDPRTGRGIHLANTPMLRGTVVTKYEEGRWTHHGSSYESHKADLKPPPSGMAFVTQEIALEPLNEPVVFSVYPVYSRQTQPVAYDVDREQLVRRPERLQQSQLNLRLETVGILNRRQLEIAPSERSVRPHSSDFRLTLMPHFQDRGRAVDVISSAAEQALQEAGALGADIYTICRTLERYLQRDGGFTYTLTSPARTPGLDPVEDFVANNRTGNCEYFASALALMLRSRNIPTRVVIGYQGGEWNSVGQFYQFRQLHTHSWVEAFLRPEELAGYVPDMRLYPRGGWLRLDPTAVTLAQAGSSAGVLNRVRQATDYAELVWIKYIVGMTSRRQQEALYRPIQDAFLALLDPVTFFTTLEASLRSRAALVANWLRGNWFSWQGGVAAMVVCLFVIGMVVVVRWLIRAIRRKRTRRRGARRRSSRVVQFYDKLERILATVGIHRAPEQTQREFAMSVAGHLAESPGTRPYTPLPRRIADAFYSVRFGNLVLSASEERELMLGLAELETVIRRRG